MPTLAILIKIQVFPKVAIYFKKIILNVSRNLTTLVTSYGNVLQFGENVIQLANIGKKMFALAEDFPPLI